jgi:hypothetical protein
VRAAAAASGVAGTAALLAANRQVDWPGNTQIQQLHHPLPYCGHMEVWLLLLTCCSPVAHLLLLAPGPAALQTARCWTC